MPSSYSRIQILMDQGRLADAETAIKGQLAEDIEDSYLYSLLGLVHSRQNRPRLAEEAARKAVSLDPDAAHAHYTLSVVLVEGDRYAEALKAISTAIDLDAEDADYFGLRAQILWQLDRYDQALESTAAGLGIDPDNDTCRYFRSIMLVSLGKKSEAEAESLSLLSDDPGDSDNHTARGWVLLGGGDGTGAERHFVEALRINPQNQPARIGLSRALKLKHPLIGWLLKLLLLADQLSWQAVLGGAIVAHWLGGSLMLADSMALVIAGGALRVGILFVFMVALSNQPLFNAVLLGARHGRYAVSDDERRGVRWAMAPLLIGWGLFLYWVIFGNKALIPLEAITWLAAARFMDAGYALREAWVRHRIAAAAWTGVALAAWIEFATHVILPDNLLDLAQSVAIDPPRDSEGSFDPIARYVRSHTRSLMMLVVFPSLALVMASCFAKEFADWLRRHAPDEDA